MHTALWSYVFVAVGGALGAIARFAMNVFLQRDVPFPWGTLGANLVGCLVMGMLAHLIAHSSWFNGAGFIPEVLNLEIIDDVQQVPNNEALAWARRAALEEGIMCGISSGAALIGALTVAVRPEMEGKTVVVVLPSFAERYMSTPLFDEAAG